MVENMLTNEAKFCSYGCKEIYFIKCTSINLSKSFKFQFLPLGYRLKCTEC